MDWATSSTMSQNGDCQERADEHQSPECLASGSGGDLAFDPDPAPEAPEQDRDDCVGEGLSTVVAQSIEDRKFEGDGSAQEGDGGGGIELSGK
jgi:hypothetical protein